MSYAQMKAFHAVVEEGSVMGAAARLSLTQPVVSQHVKKLETESGKQLPRRLGHRFELTDDGRALYSIVERFRRSEPAVRIELVMGNAASTRVDLIELRTDVAVLAGAPGNDRVHRRVASRRSLVALLPLGHPLAVKKRQSLKQLAQQPLVFREQASSTQDKVLRGFADRGIEAAPEFVLGSREAVGRGLGVGFAYGGELGAVRDVAAVPVDGFKDANVDEVICVREQPANPLVSRLLDCV